MKEKRKKAARSCNKLSKEVVIVSNNEERQRGKRKIQNFVYKKVFWFDLIQFRALCYKNED